MIDTSDVPTLKAVLTFFKNKVKQGQIRFSNDQIVLSFLEFLIKVAYVLPIICMQTYKLIFEILSSVKSQIRHQCWTRLFSEFDYVTENFADSDLEAWYFYVLSKAGVSAETMKVVSRYLTECTDPSPIVLTVLTKPHSKAANKKIEVALLAKVTDWQKISQSKWWLPLSQLWIATERSVDSREIRKLFLSSNSSQIQWDKLGVIEYLSRHVK